MSDAGAPVPFAADDLLEHVDWARALAAHLVRDEADADDLVQDALVAALRRPPDADRPLRPWFAAVLRKLALARRRGEGRRMRRQSAVAIDAERAAVPSAADIASRLDAYRVLADLVAGLPEPLRGAVYLRYHESLDSTEIGRRLGVPAATVRGRLARALEELRVRLDARSKDGRAEWLAALGPIALPSSPAPAGSFRRATNLASRALATLTTTNALVVAAVLGAVLAVSSMSHVAVLRDPAGDATGPTVNARSRSEPSGHGKPDSTARSPRRRGPSEAATLGPDDPRGTHADQTPQTAARGPFVVRARVLESWGAPAARARVECGNGRSRPGADGDAAGRVSFTLDADADVESFEFAVGAARCATRIVAAPPPTSGGAIDLGDVRLGAGGDVAGRVIDAGVPLAGVSVGVLMPGVGEDELVDDAAVAESDTDGRFTLRGVPVGTQRISFGMTGFTTLVRTVEVRHGEQCPVDVIRMERPDPATRVRGVVRTPQDAAAGGALVMFRHEGRGSTGAGTVTTDAEGRFEIVGGSAMDWRLCARDASGRWSPAPFADVRSGAEDVVLRLTEPRWAEVSVTRADGVPVERFAVDVRAPGGLILDHQTEDLYVGGVARIRLPAQPFTISVTAPGFAVGTVESVDPSSVGSRIDVRVVALPGVGGRVTAGGVPVVGARVTLRDVVHAGTRATCDGFVCSTLPADEAGATTDADGGFRLTLRRAGRFVLRAEAPEFAPAEAGPLDLSPAVGRSGIAIALTQGGGIEGRVVAAPGRGLDGVIVGISRGDGDARTFRTAPDGVFRFERLAPGPWLVRLLEREIRPGLSIVTAVDGEPLFEGSCNVADGVVTQFDLDLRVEGKSAARGELRVDGSPSPGWKVTLLAGTGLLASEETTSVNVAESGAFRLVAPRPGDYVVRARSPQGLQVFVPVRIADAEVPLALDLHTGAVNVRGAALGEPLALLGEETGGRCALAQVALDAHGSCGPTQFPAGRTRLVRAKFDEADPRAWPTVAEGVVVAGATLTLDVPAK